MKISVIIPCYNSENCIHKCINSILNQTHTELELICVDDCSSDNTLGILEEYAMSDSRVKIYKSDKNSGSAKNPIDRGISKSTSEFICVVGHDDYLDAMSIANIINRQKETDADIVCQRMVLVDQSGNVYRDSIPSNDFDFGQVITGKNAALPTTPKWIIGCNGALIRKSLYEKLSTYGVTHTHMNIDEYDTRELLVMSDKVAFVDANYYYVLTPDSITRKATYKIFEVLITNKMLVNLFRKTYGDNSKEAKAIEFLYLYSISNYWSEFKKLSPRMDDENRIKSYNIIKEHFKELKIKDVVKSSVSLKRKLTYLLPFWLFKFLENFK